MPPANNELPKEKRRRDFDGGIILRGRLLSRRRIRLPFARAIRSVQLRLEPTDRCEPDGQGKAIRPVDMESIVPEGGQ